MSSRARPNLRWGLGTAVLLPVVVAGALAGNACISNSDVAVDGGSVADGAPGTSDRMDGAPLTDAGSGDAATSDVLHLTTSDGTNTRTYELSVPDTYDAGAPLLPLVFVFHGSGGNGDEIRHDLPIESFSGGGALFAYPDAIGDKLDWDLTTPNDSNLDIAFFDAMMSDIAESHPYDASRVFVVGMSRGGFFSNALGCRRHDQVRAVGSFEGGGPFELKGNGDYDDAGQLICPGDGGQSMAAFLVEADDDTVVPLYQAQETLTHWSYEDGCLDAGGAGISPSPCQALNGCSRDVVWCEIATPNGHTIWPPGIPAVWTFFAAQH